MKIWGAQQVPKLIPLGAVVESQGASRKEVDEVGHVITSFRTRFFNFSKSSTYTYLMGSTGGPVS